MSEEDIKNVLYNSIQIVFNGWTALRLTVDQGMANIQNVMEMVNIVTEFCMRPNIDYYDICDLLEDIMDERFNTICEDDSPSEVARVLMKLVNLCRMNNIELLRSEVSALPVCELWLSRPEVRATIPIQPHEVVEDESSGDEAMEEDPDPGWTVVKSKKK